MHIISGQTSITPSEKSYNFVNFDAYAEVISGLKDKSFYYVNLDNQIVRNIDFGVTNNLDSSFSQRLKILLSMKKILRPMQEVMTSSMELLVMIQ